MKLSESVEVLHSLGLSEYEAKVYVALVTEGASEGRRLSMSCGVPRTKVYSTLKKLVERGIVLELPEQPRKFAPLSPVKAFETHMQHLKEEAHRGINFLKESSNVISLLEETYEKTRFLIKPKREDLWSVHGRSDVLKKLKKMIVRAKASVYVVTTENGLVLLYKAISKLLDKLVESGVNIQIWTSINSHNKHLARELNYVCKVEKVDIDSLFLFLCVDDREFLLARLTPKDFNMDSSKDFGVFSRSPDLYGLIFLLLPKKTREVYSPKAIEVYVSDHTRLLKHYAR